MSRPLIALLALMFAQSLAVAATGDCVSSRYGTMVCPPPDGQCILDRNGDVVCSPPGGEVRVDRYGVAVCGKGQCVVDRLGQIRCSNSPRGAASLDRFVEAACTDGCHTASAALCSRPAQR